MGVGEERIFGRLSTILRSLALPDTTTTVFNDHPSGDIVDDKTFRMASSSVAMRTFSLANDIYTISPQDEIYKFDPDTHKRILRDSPWSKE